MARGSGRIAWQTRDFAKAQLLQADGKLILPAAYVPARNAMTLEPLSVLRSE